MSPHQKEELFGLPVQYNGQDMLLPAKLVQMGYTYKIFVEVQEQQIIFEPDEERNFRAVMPEGSTGRVSLSLVQQIGKVLETLFR
jgi:hypothetical protein